MGKLKGKIAKPGDNGMLSYKDDSGVKVEINYNQPYSLELGIGTNTRVSFDVISTKEGNVAVSVAPINKGTITDINIEAGSGIITETESGIKYPFSQNYLKESGFELNKVVTYNLVFTKDGSLQAVSLSIVA